jgi:endogenous inhibitor of DNA gyrase (YacG/DUF329 family)
MTPNGEKRCLHKDANWVDITTFAEEHRTFMDADCGGTRTEQMQRCPRCGDEIPEENDETGEGPVYWTLSDKPYCSMECVIFTHRQWLENEAVAKSALTDGWS